VIERDTHLEVAADVSGLSLKLSEDSGLERYHTLSCSGRLVDSIGHLIGTTKLLYSNVKLMSWCCSRTYSAGLRHIHKDNGLAYV
jgi:hypothetical protein